MKEVLVPCEYGMEVLVITIPFHMANKFAFLF